MMARPTAASAAATIMTKKTKICPFTVVPLIGKGDKGKIDGIEHELNGHEDSDEIALDEKADDAEREKRGAEKQIPGERDVVLKKVHFVGRPFSVAGAGESDGAEDGDEDEHRSDFKGQKQFVEEHLAEDDKIRAVLGCVGEARAEMR